MTNNHLQLCSPVAPLMERLIEEKQAVGYKYQAGAEALARLDRFLVNEGLTQCELPRALMRKWLTKQPHESATNHQSRTRTVRQFAVLWSGKVARLTRQGLTSRQRANAASRPGSSLMWKFSGCFTRPTNSNLLDTRRLQCVRPAGAVLLPHALRNSTTVAPSCAAINCCSYQVMSSRRSSSRLARS